MFHPEKRTQEASKVERGISVENVRVVLINHPKKIQWNVVDSMAHGNEK